MLNSLAFWSSLKNKMNGLRITLEMGIAGSSAEKVDEVQVSILSTLMCSYFVNFLLIPNRVAVAHYPDSKLLECSDQLLESSSDSI
jgi:hypothetical protein